MPKFCLLKRHSSWATIAKVSVALSIALPAAQAQVIPIREGEAYLTCFPGIEEPGTANARIAFTHKPPTFPPRTPAPVGGIVDVRNPAFAP